MQTATKENVCTADTTYEKENIPTATLSAGKGYLAFKRLMDVFFAVILGLVLLVPLILMAIMIRLDSPGPVLFLQRRMGKDGKHFTIYKFRTMSTAAPRDVAARELDDPDQYLTKFGAFLRKSSIDELPQLWNIITGDMSFVGYRPICLTETELNDLRASCGVFAVRPGITGLAQVSGRDNLSIEEKVRLDSQYVSNCSLKMDIQCLLLTVKTVLSGEGVN